MHHDQQTEPVEQPSGTGDSPVMSVMIVVESEFGNTRQIAEAIAAGISSVTGPDESAPRVRILDVDDATAWLPSDLDLLIVGAPTHGFGMSTRSSRAEAVRLGGEVSIGVHDWLIRLRGRRDLGYAAFDTKQKSMRALPGSAARRIDHELEALGMDAVDKPETFFVDRPAGPLTPGECARAWSWGAQLAARCRSTGRFDCGTGPKSRAARRPSPVVLQQAGAGWSEPGAVTGHRSNPGRETGDSAVTLGDQDQDHRIRPDRRS